jgi:hypothetical protein
MTLIAEKIYQETKFLSDEEKETLAERLLFDVSSRIDPEILKSHLQEVERRFQDFEAGKTEPMDLDEALRKARRLIAREA